jgi:hypothetical protein
MKWTVWLFFSCLLAIIGVLMADLLDWDPFKDNSGPEYVKYKIVWIVLPKPKPWFEWMK